MDTLTILQKILTDTRTLRITLEIQVAANRIVKPNDDEQVMNTRTLQQTTVGQIRKTMEEKIEALKAEEQVIEERIEEEKNKIRKGVNEMSEKIKSSI